MTNKKMTNGAGPYNRLQLVDDLSMLSSQAVASKADVELWNRLAREVRLKLLSDGIVAGLGVLPDSLWDYLADTDLRLMDPDYAAAQQRIIGRLIERLRRENEPPQRNATGQAR